MGAAPSVSFFLLTALSCALATFGLIVNSVAVIIGAMLVAPLMGPIMGVALASVARRPGLYRRSALSLVSGAVFAIALSATLAFAARHLPFGVLEELPSEVDSRAHPSVFDLAIALAGGAAGAYAAVRMKGTAALVGVAIATALMPPLCSVGIGIALNNDSLARGAGLLFLTNLVAITSAAVLVFAVLGLRSNGFAQTMLHSLIGAAGLLLIGATLVVLTIHTVNDARSQEHVRRTVADELARVIPGSELLDFDRDQAGDALRIRIRVQVPGEVTVEQVRVLQEGVADQLGRPVELTFVGVPTLQLAAVEPQGTRTPTVAPSPTPRPTPTPPPTATPTVAPPTPTSAPTPPLLGNS